MKKIFVLIAVLMIPKVALAGMHDCLSNLGLGLIPNGTTIVGYLSPQSMPGNSCASMYRSVTCTNGALNGPDLYPECTDVNLDCNGIPNGGAVWGYITPFPPCISATVFCYNGVLSGPMPAPSCTDYP